MKMTLQRYFFSIPSFLVVYSSLLILRGKTNNNNNNNKKITQVFLCETGWRLLCIHAGSLFRVFQEDAAQMWGDDTFSNRQEMCKMMRGFYARTITINRAMGYISSGDHRKWTSCNLTISTNIPIGYMSMTLIYHNLTILPDHSLPSTTNQVGLYAVQASIWLRLKHKLAGQTPASVKAEHLNYCKSL